KKDVSQALNSYGNSESSAMAAANLPTKEQCETWTPKQVADFLYQNGMTECSRTVRNMKIDGRWLLNLSSRDLCGFNPIHQPQLQKMVQDIKKNDGSIMNRLKRFQNEQAAFIRKTGKNTWDRFKNKPPPKVPVRDYNPDNDEEGDQWSGSEFDSDTYEDPQENNDDSYEPPPSERKKRIFHPAPSASYSKGDYIGNSSLLPRTHFKLPDSRDRHGDRPAHPPRKPFLPSERPPAIRPDNNDEDYINPEDEDDNYIDPSEKPVSDAKQGAKRKEGSPHNRRGAVDRTDSPGVSKKRVIKFFPCFRRPSVHLRPPPQSLPPVASPRILSKKLPPDPVPEDEDMYEVCDADEGLTVRQGEAPVLLPRAPAPQPREMKKPHPPLKPVTCDFPAEMYTVAFKRDIPNAMASSPPRTLTKPRFLHFSVSEPPVEERNQSQRRLSTEEKDADIQQKPWFAGSCDRKTAEETLFHSKKDGSFMVRKSSGHDVQQPYTLVVFYKNRVYNIPVRYIQSSHQYALGREKKGEERFSSVCSIIENHQKNALVLIDSQNNSKDSTKLCCAVKP
ncbi:B-cell linker protein isoform X1, partial [Arapaima gigas]